MKIPTPAPLRMDSIKADRRHPDIFTPEEAIAYLHLDPADVRTLDTLRDKHDLVGFRLGKGFMYHRKNLDELVARLAGMRGEIGNPKGR